MRARLFAFFTLTFVAAYASADILTSLHDWRWPIEPPNWPFWPTWSYVYLSLDLLIPLAFWKVRLARLGAFSNALLVATLAAWPFFVLFPLPTIPVPTQTSPPSWVFQLADLLNLNANFFPSLHVAYAAICAAFLGGAAWVWALAIALSTLVTHQHYTIDIPGGVALAWLAGWWARGRGDLESLCLQEIARCAARHRRYAVIGVALVAASLGRWRKRRLARVGFCYLQHLDDLLDGHLPTQAEPLEIAEDQQLALRGERPWNAEDPLDRLGAALHSDLIARTGTAELAVAVIEEMKLDRRRVKDSLLLDEAELWRHLSKTFELSLDLMLVAADSSLRSAEAPHLLKALAWCSIVRDWDEDQSLGLINVPRTHWEKGEAQAWLVERHAQALRDIAIAREEIAALAPGAGRSLLGIFSRSINRYTRREGAGLGPRNP